MRTNQNRRAVWAMVGVLGLVTMAMVESQTPRGSIGRSGDWPQFRGPGGLGVSPERGLPLTWSSTQNIVWKTALPGAGASSPIVIGQRIYLTCYTGYGIPGQPRGDLTQLKRHLLCLNRSDGKVLWHWTAPTQLPEEPSVREHGYAANTPAADSERVYVFFGKSGVFALDHSGRPLWQADVGSRTSGWGSAASPILVGNMVIINASVESESLVALDKRTGREIWRAGGIQEAWNTPQVVSGEGGKTELVMAVFGKLLGFDLSSGERLWSCATDIRWYMVPSVVTHDGIVYSIGGRTGGALAVRAGGRGDVTASHRLWTGRKGSNVSSPILHGGHLYWAHENLGIVYCAEAQTGRIVYEERLTPAPGSIYASQVLADGRLYYLSRRGHGYVVAAKPTFEQLAHNDLSDGSTFDGSPAVSGGQLLLRSDRFLYCIGRK
ncbi:MAG: PQQ-like beta-propeller repeat protein [Abditibacteriales bacterium]|nr:PQQ-like beta-propeller repeat protein [Abditibacteriales bacterium]MDW8367047.1 PQQ-binding-like beta-propeller repeat protein [Abditibacteriales bacterium]